MDALFPTLFSKTFLVLGLQLAITWASTHMALVHFRRLHERKVHWITSTRNDQGQLDLDFDWAQVKGYFYALMAADIVVFLVLFHWGADQSVGVAMAIFGIWSILTGIELALCLVAVDENLGAKVLALTATIVVGALVVGLYTKVDLGSLGAALFLALLGLIVFNLIRLFVAIPRAVERWVAGIGVVVFALYLVYDFNRLAKLSAAGVSDWSTAIRIAISIYLDIINLFLELLDAISD